LDQVEDGDALSITVSDGQVEATAGHAVKPKTVIRKKKAVAAGAGMERLI
jgi:hypothetical protein